MNKKEKLANKNVQQGKEKANHYIIMTILTESSALAFHYFLFIQSRPGVRQYFTIVEYLRALATQTSNGYLT